MSEINNLSIFYFINQNIIFSSDISDEETSEVERILLLEILRKHFDISEVEAHLNQNPGLLNMLTSALENDQDLIKAITNSVMSHPTWFTPDSSNQLRSYLEHIKEVDESLYRRILELLKTSTECCVCLTELSDTIFQCGHTTCVTCSTQLDRCPLCRDFIQSRTPRDELAREQEELELEAEAAVAEAEVEVVSKKIKLQLIEDKDSYVKKRIEILVSNKNRLRPDNKDELTLLVKYYSEDLLLSLGKIQSEEMLTYVCALLFPNLKKDWNAEDIVLIKLIKKYLLNPNRLYRFLAVLNGNDPDTSSKISLNIPRKMRRLIVDILNKMDIVKAINMMNSNISFWTILLKSIHIGEYLKSGNYKRVEILANVIRNNKLTAKQQKYALEKGLEIYNEKVKVITVVGELNDAFLTKNKDKAIRILLQNPGIFF